MAVEATLRKQQVATPMQVRCKPHAAPVQPRNFTNLSQASSIECEHQNV